MNPTIQKALKHLEEDEVNLFFDEMDKIISRIPMSETVAYNQHKKKVIGGKNDYNYHEQLAILSKQINAILEQQKPNLLSLWILCSTKAEVLEEIQSKYPNILARYHETDPKLWQPFEQNQNISELLQEYKAQVDFDLQERFSYSGSFVTSLDWGSVCNASLVHLWRYKRRTKTNSLQTSPSIV